MSGIVEQQVLEGFKKTEIGVIPQEWSVGLLPKFIWYQEGPGLRNWQFTKKGIKVINVTNLQYSGLLNLEKTDRHISIEEFEKIYRHFECDAGDFVMASSGNSYCKSSVIRKCDLPLLMNTSVIRFKSLDGMDNSYMQAYLKSKYFKEQIDLLITGGAQPNFGPVHLNKILLPIPSSLEEQTAIANALSDVDALITSLEKLITKKRAIKTAAMQQLLTGKKRLPPFDLTHTGYKQTELGEIPEDWDVVTLNELAAIRSGGTPSTNVAEYWNGGVNWCTPTDITALKGCKYLTKTARTITALGVAKSAAEILPVGTILMTSRATIGECAIARDEVTTNQGFKSFICNQKADNEFLFYLLGTLKDRFIGLCSGSTFLEISTSQVRSFVVAVAGKEEQTAIAAILSDMDAEIQTLQQRLNKTQQLKQGMMQELLTGRTRLI